MPSWIYVAIFLFLLFLWPFVLFEEPVIYERSILPWLVLGVNTFLAILVWRRSSVPELTFPQGLDIISNSMMSGCANITILYLPLILIVVYVLALHNTLRGLVRGKAFTQERWNNLVRWFNKHSLRQ